MALELFKRIANTNTMWGSDRVVPKKASGVYEVDAYTAVSAKIDSLATKLEGIALVNHSSKSAKMTCEECGATHATADFPILTCPLEQVDYVKGGQRQNNLYSNTYNSGWRNHPNFSWKDHSNRHIAPNFNTEERKPALEEILGKFVERTELFMSKTDQFMRKTEITFQNQQASIKNLEHQVGQIAQLITARAPGTLPADTEVNPKEQIMAINVVQHEINAITTRSGVQLPEIHAKKPAEVPEKVVDSVENMAEREDDHEVKSTIKPHESPILFPQRLKKTREDKQFNKFVNMLRKLHINIPFLEAITQIPSYAKLLKKMMSSKKKLEELEEVTLNEECSAILQNKLLPKLKDLGSFSILCIIGDLKFNKVLCDLGASINLMPLSLYKKLGLGEPKEINIRLQLTDRSICHTYGVVEDVLVKVHKFIFPTDFIILDMEEDENLPLILGRPFLATAQALIDVEKGDVVLRAENQEVTFTMMQFDVHEPELENCSKIDFELELAYWERYEYKVRADDEATPSNLKPL